MAVLDVPEAVVGGLLLFFAPGYGVARAVFPEWRLRGPLALRRAVETIALAFVTSVALTVIVGSFLLISPGGFQAAWSDPVLEAALAAVTVLGLVVAGLRGAFSRPGPAETHSTSGGETGAWELTRELDRLGREERQLRRELESSPPGGPRTAELARRIDEIRARDSELRRHREEEYAE